MKTAAISKLKATLSEHIASVKRGEEVIVTERGKPVARIVPITAQTGQEARLRELINRGLVRPGRPFSMKKFLADLPTGSVPKGTVAKIIDEERKD